MELLEGEALDLWLRNRPPPTPREVVGILKQLFSGLAAAHAANVIHRDLKPTNLFMAKLADGTDFLKILDFGLSKRVDPAAPEKTHGTVVGTPLYMAPEQTVGDPSTPATDLYAAGCIAYELLTGRPPFTAETGSRARGRHGAAASGGRQLGETGVHLVARARDGAHGAAQDGAAPAAPALDQAVGGAGGERHRSGQPAEAS